MDELAKHLGESDLLSYEEVLDFRLKPIKLDKFLDKSISFNVIDEEEEYGLLLLIDGGTLSSEELSEDSMGTWAITENEYILLAVASFRTTNTTNVYQVHMLGKAFPGHYRVLRTLHNYFLLIRKYRVKMNKGLPYEGRKLNLDQSLAYLPLKLMYDDDLLIELTQKNESELFEYFDQYKDR